jgi:hypothetical protein
VVCWWLRCIGFWGIEEEEEEEEEDCQSISLTRYPTHRRIAPAHCVGGIDIEEGCSRIACFNKVYRESTLTSLVDYVVCDTLRQLSGNDYQCSYGCGFAGLYHVVAKHELTCPSAPTAP